MCRKRSFAMQTIEDMCASQNMNAEELAGKAKLLLDSYRRVCWASLGSCRVGNDDGYCICDDDINRALEYLNTYPASEPKIAFEKKLRTLFDSRWMVELVDDTMVQVKEFPDLGDTYFDILSKFYLSKFKLREAELLDLLKLERSCYYDRKKEAVLAFGLALWGTVLPKLMDIVESESLDPYNYCIPT